MLLLSSILRLARSLPSIILSSIIASPPSFLMGRSLIGTPSFIIILNSISTAKVLCHREILLLRCLHHLLHFQIKILMQRWPMCLWILMLLILVQVLLLPHFKHLFSQVHHYYTCTRRIAYSLHPLFSRRIHYTIVAFCTSLLISKGSCTKPVLSRESSFYSLFLRRNRFYFYSSAILFQLHTLCCQSHKSSQSFFSSLLTHV